VLSLGGSLFYGHAVDEMVQVTFEDLNNLLE